MLNTRLDPDYQAQLDAYFAASPTADDLTAWRTRQLADMVGYLQHNSPFYREQLAGFEPTTPLADLPFTTKADLREAQLDILSQDLSTAQVYYETTGTTGRPTPCPRHWQEVSASTQPVVAAWRAVLDSVGLANHARVALMGPSELYAFGDTFSDTTRELEVMHVKIWPESPRVGFKKALELIRGLSINVVVCAPALALSLAKAAVHNGFSPAELGIRAFFVLGEICTPQMRDNIASLWGAETFNILYGSQEAHAIATGCPEHQLHLSEPNYVFETLDPVTARPTDTGEGELCLTMLTPGIKPLLRYRTGDIVTIEADGCRCGMPGRIVTVHGRLADRVRVGGHSLWPHELESMILGSTERVVGYTVDIDRGERGDTLMIRLDVTDASAPQLGAQEQAMNAAFSGLETEVRVEVSPLDPVNNAASYIGWKAARIRDRRSGPNEAETVAGLYAHRYAITS